MSTSPAKKIKRCSEDMLSVLPKHILYQLFEYFDLKTIIRCSRVCKRWYELITNDPWFWRNIDDFSRLEGSQLMLLQRAGGGLRKLSGYSADYEFIFKALTQSKCFNVREIDIRYGSPPTPNTLSTFLKEMESYTISNSLTGLQTINMIYVHISAEAVGLILALCPTLKKLCFHYSEGLSSVIHKSQCKLESISIWSCEDTSNLLKSLVHAYETSLKSLRLTFNSYSNQMLNFMISI